MEIDFVIPWVDGNDAVWQKKMRQFRNEPEDAETNEQRFRDFGTLKYLLRSIEMNANWVRKIWIVTDNQRPEWLNNTDNRVEIVDHTDFIPEEYLPTFNSSAIMINLWRIPGLAENFVVLNDDFLFLHNVREEDFFRADGKLVDTTAQFVAMPRDKFAHIAVNNISLINNNFNKKEWLKKNWKIAFNIRNGLPLLFFSMFLSPLPYFTRFYDPHVGTPYTKTNFEKAWHLFGQEFVETSRTKFRALTDVTEWVVRYYQLLTGNIYVRRISFGKYLTIDQTAKLAKVLRMNKIKMIALNDQVATQEQEDNAVETIALLERYFNKKSAFEI